MDPSALSPALTGYLTNVVDSAGGEALLLWIPFNSDGSVRAETRLLAMGSKPAGSARLNTNGDSLPVRANRPQRLFLRQCGRDIGVHH